MGALSAIIGSGIKNTAATLLTGQEKKEGGISVGGGSFHVVSGEGQFPNEMEN
jgi:hypothetical protein